MASVRFTSVWIAYVSLRKRRARITCSKSTYVKHCNCKIFTGIQIVERVLHVHVVKVKHCNYRQI